VNFAWHWLKLTTEVDADPFVDVRTGFITGKSPKAAVAFMRRIREVVENQTSLPAAFVDNFGPNETSAPDAFDEQAGHSLLPVYSARMAVRSIFHGTNGFTDQRVGSLTDAGILHFGGHGYPDQVVDGISSALVAKLNLAPCVVFSGACYTGVTGRWFDLPRVSEKWVNPTASFSLNLLANNVIGYFAALHADHGMPVYQEMEYLATTGASLGDIIKHTYDGVILASGGELPNFETLTNGMAELHWSPSEMMRKGTASRILFGDPSLILTAAFSEPPFEIQTKPEGDKTLHVQATLKNERLTATFTDTYHADLAADSRMFNDRALISLELPKDWKKLATVRVIKAEAGRRAIRSRLVGWGLEEDGSALRCHLQVDLAASGFMQSEFRKPGSTIEFILTR